MLLFYIALLLLIISSIRYNASGYNEDYLSFDTTNAIKGIFILLVFIKHVTPYITSSGYMYDGIGDNCFQIIDRYVGQWIVAMFLFYSGYGIMESIKKKGENYISSIPFKRLLTVLLNFDVAVLIYICIRYSLSGGANLELAKCVLSLIGWESMGNSNWYIFVIMLAYLLTYISFKISKCIQGSYIKPCIVTNVLLLLTMIVLSYLKESWWYDTILCFGAGLIYSNYKTQIGAFLKKHFKVSFIVFLLLLGILTVIPFWIKGLIYNLYSIVFCIIIVMLTMKFTISSSILVWLGQHLFPLYIYQRVLMIILSSIVGGVFVANYPILYVISCLAITIIITYYYKYWAIRL